MQGSTSRLLKQLGLAAMGQMLPDASALSPILGDMRKGLLATVVTGVLIASFLLLGCFAFYRFLSESGFSESASLAISAVILLMLALISGLFADKYISRTKRAKQDLSISFIDRHGNTPNNEDTRAGIDLNGLVNAFIDGFAKEQSEAEQSEKAATTFVEPENTEPDETKLTTRTSATVIDIRK